MDLGPDGAQVRRASPLAPDQAWGSSRRSIAEDHFRNAHSASLALGARVMSRGPHGHGPIVGLQLDGLSRSRCASSSKARYCSGPGFVASFLTSLSLRDFMSVGSPYGRNFRLRCDAGFDLRRFLGATRPQHLPIRVRPSFDFGPGPIRAGGGPVREGTQRLVGQRRRQTQPCSRRLASWVQHPSRDR